ncbi:MAG TPA: F0F1 ATP synthase subunit B [Verrucomicrobiae bacterium]|jgi:F-type H+-transporting ATPase subunit b|nr:F0F1 ATP synthase subunit B [Verrucomicrobiae bacterium]
MEFFKSNIIPGEVFVQLLAFVLVFLALKKLAWKPVLGSLEARREKIRKDFEAIEAAKKEIEGLKAQYAALLQKIEDEARAKVQEAVDEGRRIGREIQEKARAESQATFDKAKENLALEAAKTRLVLRQEIADLAMDVSERILKEKLSTDKAQNAKILEIIEELEKTL